MATQTLEFSAGTGLTLDCKLFELGDDTVVSSSTAVEKANDKNRYAVNFTDIPHGVYRLNAFVGATGGFANEVYDIKLETDIYFPRSEVFINAEVEEDPLEVNVVAWGGESLNTAIIRSNVVRVNGAQVHSQAGRMEVNTTHLAGKIIPASCETTSSAASTQVGLTVNLGGLSWGSGGVSSLTPCTPLVNGSGMPIYRVNDLVYLRESASIGSIEPVRITDVSSYNNTWVYKIASASSNPRAPSTYGDRISHITGSALYYTESEFCDLCTALNIAKEVLEKRLEVIDSQIAIYGSPE